MSKKPLPRVNGVKPKSFVNLVTDSSDLFPRGQHPDNLSDKQWIRKMIMNGIGRGWTERWAKE